MSAGTWIAVGALGGVGALLRHAAGRGPWSVLALNVAGAFALGWAGTEHPAVAAGLLGAMTTFSTWMAQAEGLTRGGRPKAAAVLIAFSLALGLAAVAAGRALG